MLQNMRDIIESLGMDGALLGRIDHLPTTIKDAISFTGTIGERYLWIDSLCIVQDDADDKKNQISALDQIYSSAVLTVAVTSDETANDGLAGMGAGPRTFRQHIEKVQDMYLANRSVGFDTAVNDSIWNTRAWTFQERVMSPRVLFVAKQRCFFTCHHRQDAVMESEDVIEKGLERTSKPDFYNSETMNFIPSSQSVNNISYRHVVEAYSSRQLRFVSDTLDAFEGIAACPIFRSDFVFGLPRSELDSQLLWQPSGPIIRRRDPETGIALFPSWSWAGWIGKVRCNTDENLSRIEWIEANGERFSGKDFRYPKGVNADVIKRLNYRMQWKGALKNGVPYYWEKSGSNQWFLHPTAPENERILGPSLGSMTDQLAFEAEWVNYVHSGLGHYWTMAIWNHKCTRDSHVVCPLPLRGSDGYIGGYIMVPGELSTKMSEEVTYGLVSISRCKIFQQRTRGEGNPDLLVDSEATTMERRLFRICRTSIQPKTHAASTSSGMTPESLGVCTTLCW